MPDCRPLSFPLPVRSCGSMNPATAWTLDLIMQVLTQGGLQASPWQLQAYVASLAGGHSASRLAAQMRLGQAAADRVVASITAAFPRLSGFQEGVSCPSPWQDLIRDLAAVTSPG